MRQLSKLPPNWQALPGSLSRQAMRAKLAASAPRENRYARWHVAAAVEHEPEGWLLSYLDLLSLLVVVFVTLLAISKIALPAPEASVAAAAAAQPATAAQDDTSASSPEPTAAVALVSPLLREDLNPIPALDLAAYASPPLPPEPEPPALAELELNELNELDELGQGIDVSVGKGTVSFRISSESLFAPGQANLIPSGAALLERLTKVLLRNSHLVSIEGHSDSMPIKNNHFPSNWELSASRATSVLRHLVHSGIAPQRLRAIGYADTRPLVSNATPAGRATNRRVELVVQTHRTKGIHG